MASGQSSDQPTTQSVSDPIDILGLMTEQPTSRNIPLPIQREVRQRCGFGCVVCGMPLYEYEHLLGWAQVERHVATEITLLCDQHHREDLRSTAP